MRAAPLRLSKPPPPFETRAQKSALLRARRN